MDGLFSHAPAPDHDRRGVHPRPPETWAVEVPVGIVEATEGFLDYLHLWWPLSEYSTAGAGGQLWWDQSAVVEETESGESVVWGKTEVWDPSLTVTAELALPGAEGDRWALTVEPGTVSSTVVFRAPVPRSSPASTSREELPEDFWGGVLGFYGRFMGATEKPTRR